MRIAIFTLSVLFAATCAAQEAAAPIPVHMHVDAARSDVNARGILRLLVQQL